MAYQNGFPMGTSNSSDSSNSTGAPNMLPMMNPWMPSSMPWTMENPPQLVRFGEQSTETGTWGIPRPKLKYFKRKSDLDFNPKPAKIHITEEKMAAQLKNMHISNSYIGEQGFSDTLEENECLLPTLVLSKEVQSLTSFQEPLLPQCLLPKIEKPTRALVLWKPPAGSLTSQMISNLTNTDEEEVDNVNNNSSTPDLNAMTSSGCSPINLGLGINFSASPNSMSRPMQLAEHRFSSSSTEMELS